MSDWCYCIDCRRRFPEGRAIRDAVLFGTRLTAAEAVSLNIVDLAVKMDSLEHEAARLINTTLGRDGIDREALRRAKQDVYTDSEGSKHKSNL